ncbi:universal stress protein [Olsenella profusa]|uniref:Universal stress protein n=1 Tax=Olsenella profusa TaxID=138595 RepID=A0ABS2EZT1_9ACTN|nr:universal stress protein [Olsenella profusa]MBM6774224.1 universal stress protein [Olsenella profusa]
MFFKNILVPYDESDHAKSALHVALGMAGQYPEAKVHVVTVIPSAALPNPTLLGEGFETPYAIADPSSYERIMDTAVKRAVADAEEVVDQSRDDAQCKIVADAVIAGSPVEGIADYVESHDIDLVVMGRRGLGALRGMLGSVSFGVLRSVDVPVMTVR